MTVTRLLASTQVPYSPILQNQTIALRSPGKRDSAVRYTRVTMSDVEKAKTPRSRHTEHKPGTNRGDGDTHRRQNRGAVAPERTGRWQ